MESVGTAICNMTVGHISNSIYVATFLVVSANANTASYKHSDETGSAGLT